MLLDLRDTIRNSKPIKYTLITVITIPFALVGIGSYLSGSSEIPVAKVGGEEIGEQALDAAYRQERQRLAQMFGGEIPAAFDDEALLRNQALERLVIQRVLADEVSGQRFAVGDETLGRAIRQRPEFQVDGRFDKERYEQLLGGQVAGFEAQYRDELALDQFRDGVVATSFTLPSEAKRLDALARQVRTVGGVRFDAAAARGAVTVDDAAVQARFDERADSFRFPPRAKVAWIDLSAEGIAADIDVSDTQAKAWYEENRDRFVTPELREASHILFTVDDPSDTGAVDAARAKAEAAAARIAAGESFVDVAREVSEDPGSASSGGSLGAITPGSMVPAFEKAVYALDGEGSVSEPVVTEFGVHLIRVDKITPESGRSFDDVKDQAIAAVRADRADSEFFELREQLTELAFDSPESLEPASDATGLEIRASDWIDADTDAGPVLSNPAVQAAIFSDEVLVDGNNSEPLEVGDRHVVVVRVTEHEGPRPKTLDDVREQLVATLRAETAAKSLESLADEAVKELAAGAAPKALADAAEHATAIVDRSLTRGFTEFDRAALATLFAAPVPTADAPSTGTLELANGDRLAWRIDGVTTPPVETVAEAGVEVGTVTPAVASGADPRRGGAEFEALVGALRARADVDLDP